MAGQETAGAKTRAEQEQEFAEWINPEIIAEIIFEELESAGHEPALSTAKIIYLDILEHALYEAVKSAITHNPAFKDDRAGLEPQRAT